MNLLIFQRPQNDNRSDWLRFTVTTLKISREEILQSSGRPQISTVQTNDLKTIVKLWFQAHNISEATEVNAPLNPGETHDQRMRKVIGILKAMGINKHDDSYRQARDVAMKSPQWQNSLRRRGPDYKYAEDDEIKDVLEYLLYLKNDVEYTQLCIAAKEQGDICTAGFILNRSPNKGDTQVHPLLRHLHLQHTCNLIHNLVPFGGCTD